MRDQLDNGRYASDSELLRDLIRKEQVRAAEVEAIRRKLVEGEKSGFNDNSSTDFLSELKEKADNFR